MATIRIQQVQTRAAARWRSATYPGALNPAPVPDRRDNVAVHHRGQTRECFECTSECGSAALQMAWQVLAAEEVPGGVASLQQLLRDYAASRANDPALTRFQAEIDAMPGVYGRGQGGGCFVAVETTAQPGQAADTPLQADGCVLYHTWSPGVAQMKRLYVTDRCRGNGIGARLVEAACEHARVNGFSSMRLDTIPSMHAARALYPRLGFVQIPAYRYNPNRGTAFFEKSLVS